MIWLNVGLRVQQLKGKIERIVVRGTNWLGDAVMTVPALRALRRLFPDAQITLAIRPPTKAIFDSADFLDDILICQGGVFTQAREWRRRGFDLAVLLPNAFAPALVARLAGVSTRIGYATQHRGWLLTNPIPLPEWRDSQHESFYYLQIVAELERLLPEMPGNLAKVLEQQLEFDLNVTEEQRAQARDFLRVAGVRPDRPLVALCPGSINSRAKRWPAERYAALADRFIAELGAEVLLIGSANELEVSEEVRSRMKSAPIVLTGTTDLAQAAATLSLVDILVTNDTGPAHVASALRRPTLVIFGPTNPLTTRPLSESAEIVREPPECAPCMLRDCPIDHRCMTAISPGEVFERAKAIMHRSAGSDDLQVVAANGRLPEVGTNAIRSDKLKFVGHPK